VLVTGGIQSAERFETRLPPEIRVCRERGADQHVDVGWRQLMLPRACHDQGVIPVERLQGSVYG